MNGKEKGDKIEVAWTTRFSIEIHPEKYTNYLKKFLRRFYHHQDSKELKRLT